MKNSTYYQKCKRYSRDIVNVRRLPLYPTWFIHIDKWISVETWIKAFLCARASMKIDCILCVQWSKEWGFSFFDSQNVCTLETAADIVEIWVVSTPSHTNLSRIVWTKLLNKEHSIHLPESNNGFSSALIKLNKVSVGNHLLFINHLFL